MPPKSKKFIEREKYLEEKNKELEAELKETRRKSKKIIDKFAEFQDEVGGSIIPLQRIGLYIFVIFAFALGLGLIIYAGTHPDMEDAESTRDTMYIVGGVFVAISVMAFFIGRYWLNTVAQSPGLRKINATMFEIELAKDVFTK